MYGNRRGRVMRKFSVKGTNSNYTVAITDPSGNIISKLKDVHIFVNTEGTACEVLITKKDGSTFHAKVRSMELVGDIPDEIM
jgi:hypothetical protein